MFCFLAIILSLMASLPAHHQSVQSPSNAQVLYVDDDAPSGGDGLTWNSAFRYLQDGLDAARQLPSVNELRVAQGTYLPDHGLNVSVGDQHAFFAAVSGTTLTGGCAGIGSIDPDQRDPDRFRTVLSADLLGNDKPGFINYADNAFVILRIESSSATASFDGIVFQDGWHDVGNNPLQGPVTCDGGTCAFRNCGF